MNTTSTWHAAQLVELDRLDERLAQFPKRLHEALLGTTRSLRNVVRVLENPPVTISLPNDMYRYVEKGIRDLSDDLDRITVDQAVRPPTAVPQTDPAGQLIDVDTLVATLLDARKQWHSVGDTMQVAYATACYMSERGVALTLDGEPFHMAGHSIASFSRLCRQRGLLEDHR